MAVSLSDDSPPSNGPICPVCFRDYSDNEPTLIPRILQCGHTYCTECLDRLLNTEQDEDDFEQVVLQIRYGGREWTTVRRQPLLSRSFPTNDLKCPTCNTMNFISNRDVRTLTKNFALLGCRPSNENPTRKPHSMKHFCTEHNHEKRVYCKDCRTLVCAYCQLYGGHKNHDCAIASEAAQPSVEVLKSAMECITGDLNELNLGEKSVNKVAKKLKKNRHQCEKRVKEYFDQLIRSLEAKRNSLLMNIGSWTDEQMYILNAQLESLSGAIADSDMLQKTCECLIKGDPLDALSQQDEAIGDVTDLRNRIAGLSLQPIINPWIKCSVTEVPENILTDLLKNCTLSYDTDTPVGEDLMGSEGERADSDSLSCDDILSSSDREEDCRHNHLPQEGAGASASPGTTEKKKYYQETQLLQHWSPLSGLSNDGASMMPTLDSAPDYNSPWPVRLPSGPLLSTQAPSTSTQTPSTQGAFPSPPNNSFLSSADMPTSQASDPNSMFLNPISTKAKYTNLLHRRRLSPLSDLDSGTNSDEEDEVLPRLRIDRPYESVSGNLSSSDSHQSDEDKESGLLKSMLGATPSMYLHTGAGLRNSRFMQHVFNRSYSTGDRSASPDDDNSDEAEIDMDREMPRTTGEVFTLPPGIDSLPRDRTCHSQEDDDFAFPHHLSLPGDSGQSDEIVIPLRHHYSWTSSHVPTTSGRTHFDISRPSTSNRPRTVAIDVSQVGPGSVEVSFETDPREHRGDGASGDSDHVVED